MICAVFVTTITVVMMSMMITVSVRIILKCSCRKSFCRIIRRSLNTSIKFNSRVRQCHLSTHSNTATDQSVHFGCLKETGQRPMSASVCVYNLFSYDLAILCIIQFELLGMSEMLKDLSVFISDCNSHCVCSFLHNVLMKLNRFKFAAASRDQQPLPMNKGIRDFFPCTVIDCRDCGTSNVHSGGTGFLCETFIIQKTQGLKLVYRHLHALCGRYIVRRKAAIDRQLLYSAASDWSWHKLSFLTYVKYYYMHVYDISQ